MLTCPDRLDWTLIELFITLDFIHTLIGQPELPLPSPQILTECQQFRQCPPFNQKMLTLATEDFQSILHIAR